MNPVDVNGRGIVYRFDMRDYWGYSLIDTSDPNFALFYDGSDDDLAFATAKVDLNGKPIKYASLLEMKHKLKPEVTRDDKFGPWRRVFAWAYYMQIGSAAEIKRLSPANAAPASSTATSWRRKSPQTDRIPAGFSNCRSG